MKAKNTTSPSDHTSVPALIGAPVSVCSGAIHSGVPIAAVCCWVATSATSLAMPKSSTFTVKGTPSRRGTQRKMFSGLRSRWMTPTLCAAESAWHSCENTSRTSHAARPPRRPTNEAIVSPLRSSIASHGVPVRGSTPAPVTCTT